jgi:hypothetical protein
MHALATAPTSSSTCAARPWLCTKTERLLSSARLFLQLENSELRSSPRASAWAQSSRWPRMLLMRILPKSPFSSWRLTRLGLTRLYPELGPEDAGSSPTFSRSEFGAGARGPMAVKILVKATERLRARCARLCAMPAPPPRAPGASAAGHWTRRAGPRAPRPKSVRSQAPTLAGHERPGWTAGERTLGTPPRPTPPTSTPSLFPSPQFYVGVLAA